MAEPRLSAVLDGPGVRPGCGQGAVVVLDAATGAVRAMVGGRDYRTGAYNRAVTARRQPGSSFKPFVWLAALEHGMRPDDTVLDAPLRIGGVEPANFDGTFRGEVTVEDALAQSLNTVSVRLMQRPAARARSARWRAGWASPTRCRTTRPWRWAPARSGCSKWPRPMRRCFNGGLPWSRPACERGREPAVADARSACRRRAWSIPTWRR